MNQFATINHGYNNTFQPEKLSFGVVVPIEHYPNSPVPSMSDHMARAKQVEQLGFKALWLRDIPFNVPSFGDAGQLFDPFTYLGYLAGQTSEIALGVSSIALPLHHPAHVAKAAASVDQLSNGRLILGVASGDRPTEYPAMGIDFEKRGELFREAFTYIRNAHQSFPTLDTKNYGNMNGDKDVLPKPVGQKIPMLITGYSQQSLEWNAEHGDGWMNYPKNLYQQKYTIDEWRQLVAQSGDHDKPFMQPLYVDLQQNDDFRPEPIPLGLRIGANHLVDYLEQLQEVGTNHVAFNLRFNTMNMDQTLERLAEKVLPHFHKNEHVAQPHY
ncbi:MAG: LLM class oxidoreductase [Cyclobacteriaceae bacterium]